MQLSEIVAEVLRLPFYFIEKFCIEAKGNFYGHKTRAS
jgi:hypothetical protein